MSERKVVFSSRVSIELHLRKTFLESRGIECRIEGEALLIARPEIPGYAELVLIEPAQYELAIDLLNGFEKVEGRSEEWNCPSCGEYIEGQFTHCWRCAGS